MSAETQKQKTPDNALTRLMDSGKEPLLNIYCTAGYPRLEDTCAVIKALEDAGADMVELGMPFSDPLADGPTIQASSMQALENGMSIELLFEQLSGLETSIPIILMGYINPVLQFGIEEFCRKSSELGVSGVILPDLPFDLYSLKYKTLFEEHNLCFINLVTPSSVPDRIREIDEVTSGFIYAVSSASTTGSKNTLESNVDAYLSRLAQMKLSNQILTGFNIKDRQSFNKAVEHTRGGIIGSAFIRHIGNSDNLEESIHSFVKNIVQ